MKYQLKKPLHFISRYSIITVSCLLIIIVSVLEYFLLSDQILRYSYDSFIEMKETDIKIAMNQMAQSVRIYNQYLQRSQSEISEESIEKETHDYLTEMVESMEVEDGFVIWISGEETTELTHVIRVYSTQVEEYGWQICVGIYPELLNRYIAEMKREIRPIVIGGIAVLDIVLFSGFLAIYFRRRTGDLTQFSEEKKVLKDELKNDYLTGAYTRRFGEQMIAQAFDKCQMGLQETVILMMDVDEFKHVNDQYGHDMGDTVLREFVLAIKDTVRASDWMIRWGGDEFVCCFEQLKPGRIELVGEKILNAIHAIDIAHGEEVLKITASMGFSRVHKEDTSYEDAIKRADVALYEAKISGRDQYIIR